MVEGGSRGGAEAPARGDGRRRGRRRRAMNKPPGWPRYMIAKALKGGIVAYYWNPHRRDVEAGFPLERQALGTDYGQARIRCDGDPRDENDLGPNGVRDDWR